jgi:hydrogenase/urease accessory protein HupE
MKQLSLCQFFSALILIVGSVFFPALTSADEMRPAYLQITQVEVQTFDVLWKVPARGENERLSLRAQFSDEVNNTGEVIDGFVGGAHLQRWQISHPDKLQNATVTIDGLIQSSSEVLLRIEYLDGKANIHRLTPASPSYLVAEPPGLMQVVGTYTVLGIEHILIGIDHLLFVLVLLMLVSGARKLITTITAFTIAHSITLTLASLDVLTVPVPPVEAIIALSIVFVAAEIIRSRQGNPGVTERKPWIVAFSFGLLHGLGFAAALGEIGLPQSAVPAALLFFNIGVEIGQLIFVFACLSLWWVLKNLSINIPKWAHLVPPYVIGSMAFFWVVERTVGFY